MERDMLTWALLFDTYGELLTEKQQHICDLRYNQDLTLGEIGELEDISRQAVRDNLLRAESQMRELEDALGLVARNSRLRQAAELLKSISADGQTDSDTILKAIALIEE